MNYLHAQVKNTGAKGLTEPSNFLWQILNPQTYRYAMMLLYMTLFTAF